MYLPTLSVYPAAGSVLRTSGASAMFLFLPLRLSASNVQQVNKWDHEHPNQVHEVPVKTHNLEMVGVEPAGFVARCHHQQRHHAAHHVGKVQAGNAEEGGAK